MAILKWKQAEGEWYPLYSETIKSLLRRDKNLSDLHDPATARKNLGIIGEVTEHWHDRRYYRTTELTDLLSNFYNYIMNVLLGLVNNTYNSFRALILSYIDKLAKESAENDNDIAALKQEIDALKIRADNIFDSEGRLIYPNGNLLWGVSRKVVEGSTIVYWSKEGEKISPDYTLPPMEVGEYDKEGIKYTDTYEQTIIIPDGITAMKIEAGTTGNVFSMPPTSGPLKILSSRTLYVKYQIIGTPGGVSGEGHAGSLRCEFYVRSVIYQLEIANNNDIADSLTIEYPDGLVGNNARDEVIADHNKKEDDGTLPGKDLNLKISWS